MSCVAVCPHKAFLFRSVGMNLNVLFATIVTVTKREACSERIMACFREWAGMQTMFFCIDFCHCELDLAAVTVNFPNGQGFVEDSLNQVHTTRTGSSRPMTVKWRIEESFQSISRLQAA